VGTLDNGAGAETLGRYVYLGRGRTFAMFGPDEEAHEYIHMLQQQARGPLFDLYYLRETYILGRGVRTNNRSEAIAYLWQAWIQSYPRELPPWAFWIPISYPPVTR
jgi:hypothetical protein